MAGSLLVLTRVDVPPSPGTQFQPPPQLRSVSEATLGPEAAGRGRRPSDSERLARSDDTLDSLEVASSGLKSRGPSKSRIRRKTQKPVQPQYQRPRNDAFYAQVLQQPDVDGMRKFLATDDRSGRQMQQTYAQKRRPSKPVAASLTAVTGVARRREEATFNERFETALTRSRGVKISPDAEPAGAWQSVSARGPESRRDTSVAPRPPTTPRAPTRTLRKPAQAQPHNPMYVLDATPAVLPSRSGSPTAPSPGAVASGLVPMHATQQRQRLRVPTVPLSAAAGTATALPAVHRAPPGSARPGSRTSYVRTAPARFDRELAQQPSDGVMHFLCAETMALARRPPQSTAL